MNDKNLNEWLFADIDDLIDCDYSDESKAENRMTDNEIIRALENEVKSTEYVDSDYCDGVDLTLIKSAVALINRQKTEIDELKHEREVLIEDIHYSANKVNEQLEEIEKLKIENKSLRSAANCYKLHYNETRAEAIKEFADRLKQKSEYYENGQGWEGKICYDNDIDNLVKEMVGDTE